jgi:hypothetical protein
MIAYVEKGIGMWKAIWAAGHPNFGSVNGVYFGNTTNQSDTTQDAAIQAIINAYNPLPDYQATAVAAIEATALAKMQTLFPALNSIDTVNLVAELWKSLTAGSKAPTTNWQSIINVYTAAVNGITAVNAAANQAAINSAVAAITWPF